MSRLRESLHSPWQITDNPKRALRAFSGKKFRSNAIERWSLTRPRSCQLPSLHHRLPARLPLARVLNSERAVQVNIAIMRTFVQLRRLMDTNRELARKIDALEKKYDEQFSVVFAAIKELITPPAPAKKQIGFHS